MMSGFVILIGEWICSGVGYLCFDVWFGWDFWWCLLVGLVCIKWWCCLVVCEVLLYRGNDFNVMGWGWFLLPIEL